MPDPDLFSSPCYEHRKYSKSKTMELRWTRSKQWLKPYKTQIRLKQWFLSQSGHCIPDLTPGERRIKPPQGPHSSSQQKRSTPVMKRHAYHTSNKTQHYHRATAHYFYNISYRRTSTDNYKTANKKRSSKGFVIQFHQFSWQRAQIMKSDKCIIITTISIHKDYK